MLIYVLFINMLIDVLFINMLIYVLFINMLIYVLFVYIFLCFFSLFICLLLISLFVQWFIYLFIRGLFNDADSSSDYCFSRSLWQLLIHYKNTMLDIFHCLRYIWYTRCFGSWIYFQNVVYIKYTSDNAQHIVPFKLNYIACNDKMINELEMIWKEAVVA
jgi:hypothetical protein